MKKIIIILLFISIFNNLQAQQGPIDKAIFKDFAVAFFYKYKYENNQALRAWAYFAGNVLGYGRVDTEIAVEQIEKNTKFRNELFRTFLRFSNSNEELLTLNLISIGMQPSKAKKLGEYILQQFQANPPLRTDEEIANKNENGDTATVRPVETKRKATMRKSAEIYLRDTVSGVDIYTLAIPKEIELVYEKSNVKISNSYDEESNISGKDCVLFPNTTMELVVMSDAKKIIGYKVTTQTNRWKLPYNLKVGMSLEELKQLNGADFTVANFEADGGGLVLDWNKGKLAEYPFLITLLVKEGSYSKDYTEVINIGDKISTEELLERPLKIIVSEIIIWKMN